MYRVTEEDARTLRSVSSFEDLLRLFGETLNKSDEKLRWTGGNGAIGVTHIVPMVGEDPIRVYMVSAAEAVQMLVSWNKLAAAINPNEELEFTDSIEDVITDFFVDAFYLYRINR